MKMIANCTGSAAIALRHALLALSFQFLVISSKAIQHQNQAIQYLQATIEKSLPWDREEALQAIAASMLLSVYEVCSLILPSSLSLSLPVLLILFAGRISAYMYNLDGKWRVLFALGHIF
jgi:hypothetical protein